MFSARNERSLDEIIEVSLGTTFPACQIQVLVSGKSAYHKAFGTLDPETRQRPTQLSTRFDLASLTMVFTAAAVMTYVDQGFVSLDQPVRDILPEFSGVRNVAAHPFREAPHEPVDLYPRGSRIDVRRVTLRQLLAHNSGLPAWLPLHIVRGDMIMSGKSPLHIDFMLRDMITGTMFSYPPTQRVVFSDVGYLILGFVLERLGRRPLRQVLRDRVVDPLGLLSVCYGELPCDDVAPTDIDKPSGIRICGTVHDENAAALGGVAGHSGLFAHAADIARIGEVFRTGGAPLLGRQAVEEMIEPQAEEGTVRRGLGFALHSVNELASSSPLGLQSFGQLGFTGTSLWIDPSREMVVACLTNHAYIGNSNDETMNGFRLTLHRALADIVPVTRPR